MYITFWNTVVLLVTVAVTKHRWRLIGSLNNDDGGGNDNGPKK